MIGIGFSHFAIGDNPNRYMLYAGWLSIPELSYGLS